MMVTLSNGHTRQGGVNPSETEINIGSIPESVDLGDGSNCIPAATEVAEMLRRRNERLQVKWYVLRSTSNRIFKAEEEMKEAGFETYLPYRMVVKKVFGIKRVRKEAFLNGLMFVHASRKAIDDYRWNNPSIALYAKYYLNKTDAREGNGLNPPLTVSDREMESFRKVCDAKDEHSIVVDPKKMRFKGNERVLVTKGTFSGRQSGARSWSAARSRNPK